MPATTSGASPVYGPDNPLSMAGRFVRDLLARQSPDLPWDRTIDADGTSIRLQLESLSVFGNPVLLCLLTVDGSVALSEQELARCFSLTAAQARVARLLAMRRTNREICEALGVTAHTARRHTEAVMLRLGISQRFEVESVVAKRAAELLGGTVLKWRDPVGHQGPRVAGKPVRVRRGVAGTNDVLNE